MKTILIIEDNAANRYLVKFILENAKYKVIIAETGEKGVKMVEDETPDLVLMDIQLPGIDGFEATKMIRNSKKDGNIPIIALTSYAMVGDKDKALDAGCTGYIEKPINPETFLEEVEKYLS